jgi:ribosome biogenesis protein ERB1
MSASDDDSSVYRDDGFDVYSEVDEEETGRLNSYEASRLMNTDDLSSDDEDATNMNTIGRVPLHWYDAYDHIGYNNEGQKIIKRSAKDRIDIAIENRDDPTSRRTVYDMYNDREVVLSERDLEIIRRVQAGAFAHPEHNDTPDYIDYYSSIKEIMPISAAPEPKRRFLPSKWEMMRVMKIVKAMREGKYISHRKPRDDKKSELYPMWNDTEDDVLAESNRNKFHLPAPKMPLPGHAESYNPPPEVHS